MASGASRCEEAIRAAGQAARLDPLSALVHGDLGVILLFNGRVAEALERARRAIEVDPGHWRGYYALGIILAARGDLDDAVATLREGVRLSAGGSLAQTSLVQALMARGERQEALALKEDLEARREARYVSAYLLASLEVSLGNREKALEWLERGLEERSLFMALLKLSAPYRFPTLRDHPRFRRIVEAVGIP